MHQLSSRALKIAALVAAGLLLLGQDERVRRNFQLDDTLRQLSSNKTTATVALRKREAPFGKKKNKTRDGEDWSWIDLTGITLSRIIGNPSNCTDVIYTGDTRLPHPTNTSEKDSFLQASWKGLIHIVQTAPALNQTCLVFFQISSPFIQNEQMLHPVWGRVPATAMVFSSFPAAQHFLYMDTDAMLAFPDHTPTAMYQTLSYDGYGANATFQYKQPGLIVNKPWIGWLCMQCKKLGLGHGCFNSGALLWRRSKAAKYVLRSWWESRLYNGTQNFFHEDGDPFFGWSDPEKDQKYMELHMGEQNRLMYIYGTNPEVRKAVWPVPRQINKEGSFSCPKDMDEEHVPCLQNDYAQQPIQWKTKGPSCFINHHAEEKHKTKMALELILGSPTNGNEQQEDHNRRQRREKRKEEGAHRIPSASRGSLATGHQLRNFKSHVQTRPM